eukprot:4113328-Pyramimonas_sp.AAC.1
MPGEESLFALSGEEDQEDRRSDKVTRRKEMEAAQLETIIERTAIRAAEKTEETVLVQIKKLAVTVARDTCREMSTELDTRMEELGSNASLFGGSTGSTAGSVHGGAGGGSFDYGGDNRMRHVAGSVDITGFVEDWKDPDPTSLTSAFASKVTQILSRAFLRRLHP